MRREVIFVSAAQAVADIKRGSHIHLSSIASVPHVLIEALRQRADAGDIRNLHFHTERPAPYSAPEYAGVFFDQGFFVGPMSGLTSMLVMLTICQPISTNRRQCTAMEHCLAT